ncbi:MAG: hypothetical protein IIA67_15195 [Planctomycetes bacterium]|nr:hypothetical protein [Planctomycetota bacterium]
MILVVIILAALCLAYANGANDNLKGVATLLGSGTTNYRGAVVWATVTTLLGSLTAVFPAGTLLKSFNGKRLVADDLVRFEVRREPDVKQDRQHPEGHHVVSSKKQCGLPRNPHM